MGWKPWPHRRGPDGGIGIDGLVLWYIRLVRRTAAILLLGVFSFLLIAPIAMAQDFEAQLPACCRTRGKHRCAKPAGNQSGRGAFQPQNENCTLFPRPGALGAYHQTPTLAASQLISATVMSHPAAHAQTEALYRISYSRASQERGPPVVLS